MGVMDRYNEKKKKKDEESQNNNTSSMGVQGRHELSKSLGVTNHEVNEDFINAFISDANNFISSAEKEYGTVGWSSASSIYDSRVNSWKDLYSRSNSIRRWLYNNKSNIDEDAYNGLVSDIDNIMTSSSSVLDSFNGVKEYYSQWETEDDYNAWYEHHSKLEADDFEEYSQLGKNASNPTWQDAQTPVNLFGWTPFGEGDTINNMVTFAEANKGEAYKQSAQAVRGGGGSSELAKLVTLIDSQMTDEEKSIYNYYIGKGDSAKAAEYLEYLDLVKRQGGEIAKGIDDNAFLEAVMGFSAGIETSIQGLKGLGDFFTGDESGTDYSATQYADQIASSNNEGFLKGLHDVSSAIGGMAPSILVGSLTGGLGGALTMGASATGNAYNEMIDLGYNQWQARGYGLLVGASEAALSYALSGISKLGGKVTNHAVNNLVSKFDNAIARTAIQLGGNMASEGLEEAIQTVLEPAFKALMTGEDFEAPEWGDVWYSALLGALTAGVLEGVPTIANTAIGSHQANKIYGADASALVGEALEIDSDNAHAQRMQARLDNNKNVSGYQLNRLVNANEETLHSQDTTKIKNATQERLSQLGENGDVSKLVDVLFKQATGETISPIGKAVINKSKFGQRVSNELNPQNVKTGQYSNEWVEGIETERINADKYTKDTGIEAFAQAVKKVSMAEPPEDESVGKDTTAKEIATEAKFEASTDGKTRIGDLEVSIKEIASVKNGEVILRLEDDSTVSAGDVEYGSSAEALLYENVADMNLNAATANAFVKGYDPSTGMSVEQYALGFREAYRYGEYNFPINEMSSKGFSDMLSDSQRNLAYNLGKTDAKYKVESKQAKIASISAKNAEKIASKGTKKGKLHNTIAPKNERQRASLKALGVVAEALGIDIYTFESPLVNGKRQGANGWFDPKDGSIHIDLHAGMSGEGTMLYTAAHELTHFIREWSPAKFKVFADFLLEQYGKKGVSVKALVAMQIEKARRNGRTIDYDTAYEEVIADSCESMLADGDVIAKIAELKAKDKGLWQKIKDFLTKLVARIKSAYEGMTPDSYEGQKVAEMLDAAERLKALWTEALVEASDSYNASKATEAIVEKDLANKDLLFNLRATESHKNKLSEQYTKDASVSLEELTKRYDKIIGIWERLGGELNSKFLNEWNNKVGKDRAFTVFKAQAGYKYNVELSSMCKKGVPLFEAIDMIVKKEVMKELDSKVISKAEKEILYDILKKHHFEIPCAICYVEQARQREGVIIDAFLNGKVEKDSKGKTTTFKLGWNEVLHDIEKEMKANGVDYTFKAVDRSIATDQYAPQDLTMDSATQEAFYNALKKIANKEISRYNKAEGKNRKLVTSVTPSAIKEVFKGTLPSNLKIFKVLFTDPTSRFTMESDLLYSSMTTHNLATAHNALYGLFNSQGGVSGYKTKQGTVVYWGDILGKKWSPSKVRDEGGIRNQSNSDFQMYTLLDQAQMYIDFTAKGYYLQAYTKVLSELKLFGLSRGKINASLIPAVYEYLNADGSVDVETTRLYAGLDKNGNLLFDDIEGINHAEAFMLLEDAEYSKSIGGICIGYSDNHILKLLDDSRVQQIIGFHDKTDDPDKRYRGARYAKNYNGLNEAINKDGKTVHIGFNPYVRKAEKMFTFNSKTETYEGEIEYNGKTYVADDIPKLAADLYLEMCEKKGYTPAYADFDFHENYYKLLADFSLYDSQGHYAPHRKVAYNMPNQVPYLDLNGKKQYMDTDKYIKSELEKELKVRDSIGEALADTSENGIIPQFKKKVNELHKDEKKLSDRSSYAPTFYSYMGKVVDGIKLEKMGAGGVVSYLKGKGVKNEEIKWSGIEAFLEGKKSVTKAELQEFVAGSQLTIEEEMSGETPWVLEKDGDDYVVKRGKDGWVLETWERDFFEDPFFDGDSWGWRNTETGKFVKSVEEIKSRADEDYGDGNARWSEYKIEGGENYREIVFKLPNSSYSNQAMKVHWGDNAEGILAHARIQDIITNDGKKMLFIEEIQSDWHNEGARDGYVNRKELERKLDEARLKTIKSRNDTVDYLLNGDDFNQDEYQRLREKTDALEAEENSLHKEWFSGKGADDAPFRTTYHEYVIKRLLRMAAEEGYDSIGWTPSWIQGLRWSEDYSEAYRIEYDQDIPSFLKKYGKKWGAKVGETSIYDGEEDFNVWSMDIPDSMKDSVLHEGQVLYSDRDTASFNGKPFWSGSVSLLDGVIEEVHTMDEAEAVDFHHSMYFSQAQVEKMESGENAFFWVDNGIVQGNWRETVPKSIIKKIEEQITISPSVVEAREFSDTDIKYSIREEAPPKKTMEGYKVFVVKNGKLYPPMVANPNAEDTPVGVWLNADIGTRAPDSKTGRAQVKAGGKGTQGGSGSLAFRPGWHLGETPLATQFDRTNPETGVKELFPENFVWALCDIAADHDYQEEAMSYGYTKNGKFQHSLAGLPKLPTDGYYKYRTNPNPDTVPWLITGAMKVKKLLSDAEVNAILAEKGLAPKHRVGGEKTLADLGLSQYDGKLFSERDTDSVSNRSLLANALESVAKNDIERKKLEEYKGKIALIDSEQAKLTEVRAKIKELSFAKGKRDTEAINKLRFEEKQTANRINTYDKQLLDLESTKALKGVLEREKQMAYKRAEQRGKEALEAYRERATKTQRELMDRYQESRKKGVEGRNMTAMRHKIKDVVKELNDYLLKGTKDKHVPIQLQKAVAEALDAVNMDTVGAEERIAKKRAEMMRAKSPEVIEKLAKEIEHIQEMGGNMEAKLSRLKTSYDSIINSDDPLIANSYDAVIANTIDKVIEVVGDTPLRDMLLYQLEAVYDMYRMVLTSIRNANKAFKAEKGKEISVLANTVIADLDGKKKKPLNPLDTTFSWNNLKPVYAFERIGSNTLTKLFNAVREGEDVWARDMTEAQAFRKEQSKKYKYDSWDFEKKYAFETNRGNPFELTLGEMMSIYAFSKDEHSKGHLVGEGFVFDPKKEVVKKVKGGIEIKVNLEDATAYNLSESVVEKINKTLSEIPGAKEFVDAMQDYLSTTMGEKGNEVSLELYQIKLFKNKNYFPLKVAPQYMAIAKEKAQGDVKIKNKGFTKDRKEGAKNPIVLSSFMDVWANHVNEMSMYHAFTLPLEDFYRVFNYKTPNMEGYAPMSVNASLENAYGTAATSYIEQLLKDLNGGARVDPTAGVINKLTGLFKKSAVFGSLSVVVQQPSAIARATALVDSKYFVGKSSGKHKEVWAEVKKYAPVAVIKEMGYFDTGMGQSSVEWLKGEKTWKDKVDDALSKAPALADEYAWCAIWNAVKRETLHTHKDLNPNSEEFLNAVGERFTEVITKTQVYDSVLSRSANMRSKDTGMKMATAFMGEPTTSINMLQDALTQGKRGNKRYARKAVGGVVASMILNSILVSLVYAGRDDDEEKTYAEKYVGTLTEELIDSVNPLTLIPFVKDVVSIVQGYDVERSDMAVITDVINAWNNLDSDNRSAYRKVEDFAGAIASIFGLPVKNIMRDARGMYNTVNSFING